MSSLSTERITHQETAMFVLPAVNAQDHIHVLPCVEQRNTNYMSHNDAQHHRIPVVAEIAGELWHTWPESCGTMA